MESYSSSSSATHIPPTPSKQTAVLGLPLVESLLLGVALEALVLDDEAHPLVEGGRDGGRLLPEEDVNGGGHGVAELGPLAGG